MTWIKNWKIVPIHNQVQCKDGTTLATFNDKEYGAVDALTALVYIQAAVDIKDDPERLTTGAQLSFILQYLYNMDPLRLGLKKVNEHDNTGPAKLISRAKEQAKAWPFRLRNINSFFH